MKKEINIGLSAYNNGYWKGIFYPEGLPASKRFEYYCKHFNTYEINASFYKFPTLKSFDNWYAKSPEGFIFSAKAPRVITHFKKFRDCSQEIADFYTVCREGLKDKLGFLLFQLPPSFAFSPEILNIIIKSLNPAFKNVIEFRNSSWWTPEVLKALSEENIIFCTPSYPNLPEEIIATATTAYIRLHGVPKLFYSGYETDELKHIAHEIETSPDISEAYIYFNNTAGNEGIINAMAMKSLVK